jgi:DNA (cytosine-5)-methyltransferase 1
VKTDRPDCLTPWDTQQERSFTPEGKAPTLAGADGGGGRNPAGLLFSAGVVTKGNGNCIISPEKHTSLSQGGGQAGQGYPCVMTAGFCAGAGPSAGGIGYTEEVSPTLKAAESGTNMVPSILCLNDQGGAQMHCTEDITGTLRAQEHGHQPLVFENHGQDSRFKGPARVSQTVSAFFGAGGNNMPLVSKEPDSFCIAGNIIDRQVKNGGNGLGCQEDIAYTLTATDHHAVFSRQRVDVFKDEDVASTQSARQHKDATDLVCQPSYQQTVGTIGYTDHKGVNNQFVSEDKCIVERTCLIRRLTPMECERLQGFPDGWTDIAGTSDSARYKALGNSVAIPCVTFVLRGIAAVLSMAAAV